MNKVKTDRYRIYHADCLQILPKLKEQSVDALISDIPYGINYAEWDVIVPNTNSALLGNSPAQQQSKLFKTRGKPLNGWSANDLDATAYQEWATQFLTESFRLLKPGSPLLILCGRRMLHHLIIGAEKSGFIYKDTITWNKQSAPFRAQRIQQVLSKRKSTVKGKNWRLGNLAPVCEPIVYLFKPYKIGTTLTDCFIQDRLGCFNADVLTSNYLEISGRIKHRQHDTEKPLELMLTLVNLVTMKNHVILDPFMGSGSTGLACTQSGRRFIGIEQNEGYFQIARQRLS